MTAPAWLDALRREAAARFAELGFPTTRLEDWRYTNVSEVAKTSWTPGGPRHQGVDRPELEQLCFPVFACSLFVFVNGHFAADLSTPRARTPGVRVRSLARALREEPEALRGRLGTIVDTKTTAFAAWNTAEFADGAVVEIGRDVDLGEPIHLVFLSEPGATPTVSHPRVWIEAAAGSRASVIEDYVSFGEERFLTDAVSEISVGTGARLEHVRLQREDARGAHISTVRCEVEAAGLLSCFAIALGGGLVRNELEVALLGEGAECDLSGVFLGTGRRHVDNHTRIDHAVPHTTSRELYKGILAGHSRGIFDGRIVVRPAAVKTDARQQSKNLLLSPGAEVDTKPQLEIRADDVRCSHGSTIGRLDPDALFYLLARGIGEREARALLVRAFSAEVTGAMRFEALRESVQDQIAELLEAEA